MSNAIRPACLLLHGFTGTPFEMTPLAQALRARGFAVETPLLPGHGTTLAECDSTTWTDWSRAAREAFDRLAALGGPVFAAGLSMGGSLCLQLGRERSPAGIACLAAPLKLYRLMPFIAKDPRLPFVGLMRHVRPIWPVPPKPRESLVIAPWEGYEGGTPLNALHSLMHGLADLRRDLGSVRAPLLVAQCPTDTTVNARDAFAIRREAGSAVKRLVWLPIEERVTGHHLVTTHCETRERVAGLVADFFSELLSDDGRARP